MIKTDNVQKICYNFFIMKKKLLLTALSMGMLAGSTYAETCTKNDLRTLYLNNQAIIYEINMRTFNANDKNGNGIVEVEKGETVGNFLNAIKRLDELKNYGINAIHVMPINPTGKKSAIGTVGSVYSMTEIAGIDPNLVDKKSKLSDKEQLKKFVSECHKRGIRVIVDIPACGSLDMSEKYPDMFVKDKDGKAMIPVDWTDVRLFKTVNEDGTLNQALLDEHKKYVDMLLNAGVDGIRADVAPIKPYEFWKELISYTRAKDAEFMFVAETAEAWAPPEVPSPTANYVKLLEAGFDGYYGNLLDFVNFKNVDDFKFVFKHINELAQKGETKAILGCFDTHDLESAYTISPAYAESIMYMNATLPVNPYYLDGFQSGDKYQYPYNGKKAEVTYTDSNIYYSHKNKIDIFNFSRKPGGDLPIMKKKLKQTIEFRKQLGDLATKGDFEFLDVKQLNQSSEKIYAYERTLDKKGVLVIVNGNHHKAMAVVNVGKKVKPQEIITKNSHPDLSREGHVIIELRPDEAFVMTYTFDKKCNK